MSALGLAIKHRTSSVNLFWGIIISPSNIVQPNSNSKHLYLHLDGVILNHYLNHYIYPSELFGPSVSNTSRFPFRQCLWTLSDRKNTYILTHLPTNLPPLENLRSDPRDLWPLRQLIRVMRTHERPKSFAKPNFCRSKAFSTSTFSKLCEFIMAACALYFCKSTFWFKCFGLGGQRASKEDYGKIAPFMARWCLVQTEPA